MNGREPWNEGKSPLLWTPTEGQRYTPAGAGDSDLWLWMVAGVAIAIYIALS